jgi:CheY-like chemotaxis protein
MPPEQFINQVRDALTYLYDPVHLQSHPLADQLNGFIEMGQATRAQQLRRLLLEILEELSPPSDTEAATNAQIHYSALHYRYIDGLTPEQIADTLAISLRQVYRKIREGIEAVASLLWDRLQSATVTSAPLSADRTLTSVDRRSLAQATVEHLNSNARPEILELRAVVNGVIKDLQSYCDRIGAKVCIDLPQPPLYICVDRTMFRQALMNLLTSGLTAQTRPIVVLNLVQHDNQIRLNFAIHSTSTQDALPLSAEKREGIGLEVAIQLFQLQGWQSVERGNDGLWDVVLELPLSGPQYVLMIDDMPDMISLFQRFTTPFAIEVIGARDADEATALLAEFTPALILLDVMLPRKDGWEFLQTLKSNPATARIPVIVCSILNEPALATALGADDYLRKPVRQDALLQMLVRWLHLDLALAVATP